MKQEKAQVRVSWQRIMLMILCGFLSLVLFVMIFATAYVEYLLDHITVDSNNPEIYETIPEDQASDPDQQFTAPSIHPTDVVIPTLPDTSKDEIAVDGVVNILLIGEDRNPGEGRQRSDSMILCSFNKKNNSITMISFLRDSYVSIPGYKDNKLNAAYQYRGPKLLNQTLALNFGVYVDADIMIDFEGFKKLIDLLGGVDIELTQAEADHLNQVYYTNLKAGFQRLNGREALLYSRIRVIDMDAMRAQRQRKVLTALVNSYKNKDITEMISLAEEIITGGYVTTTMSAQQLTGYIMTLFPMLADATINNQQIPAKGTYVDRSVGKVGDCKVMDFEINRKILENIFYPS